MTMTREEQLDAVVRNYGEWAKTECLDVAYWVESSGNLSGGVLFESSRHYPHEKCFGCYTFTRAEVEERKAQLQNKPSWDGAPVNADSLIQTEGGDWEWLLRIENLSKRLPYYELVSEYSGYSGEVIGDWSDTLENRPELKNDSATLADEGAKIETNSGESAAHDAVVDSSHAVDSDVASTLAERQKRYGSFCDVANTTDGMLAYIDQLEGFQEAESDQREAARMILQKLARAFSGDPDYIDNWHDIQGYAKLVEDRLKEDQS